MFLKVLFTLALSLFFFLPILGIGDGLDKSSQRGYKPFEINKGGVGNDEKKWVNCELSLELHFQFHKDS